MALTRDITENPAASQDALQVAINALLHSTDMEAHDAVRQLQWIYWRFEDIRRAQGVKPQAAVIPFVRPIRAAVRQLNPAAWPDGAA